MAITPSRNAPTTSLGKQTTQGRFDANGRVLVHIHLNGSASLDEVTAKIEALKGTVLDTNSTYRHGVMAAYLPINQIETGAKIVGVRAMTMEYAPQHWVGEYTSQSAAILRTNTVNQTGVKGKGITIGVISDSFNTAKNGPYPPATTAEQDVASGDLPVVRVLQDYPYGGDEGRAMCQIVYDEAPHSHIAFATADRSEVGFANNIIKLRTLASADVIVDDVGYYDEPVFSDGMVAQAVNTVATSTTLPSKPVIYCSSAGNDGNNGYRSAYRNLNDAEVRKHGNHGNLQLDVNDPSSPYYLDPSLTAGGWFNWNSKGGTEPSTIVGAPGPTDYYFEMFLQWDDLFDLDHGITTNYNFLVFDENGKYLSYFSSTGNTFGYQEPIQAILLTLGTNYQIAITKTTETDPLAGPVPSARHLALYTTLDGASTLEGKYFQPAPLNVPNIYGHAAAEGAIAVAAYDYSWRPALPFAPELENFSSPGPSFIYFDQNDQRLSAPEVRQKPEVAGIDGVVTTFFGSPYYNFPYAFFGTSAAAPSVAGTAALMVEEAGGKGSLDPAAAKEILELSARPRNSTVEQSQAFGINGTGAVSVTALGMSYFSANYLQVNYVGAPGTYIDQLTIDGSAAGLTFDTEPLYYVLGNLNGINPADITVIAPSAGSSSFTLKFKKGAFKSDVSFGFTVGQDAAGTFTGYSQNEYGVGVDAEDLAYGANFSATFGGKSSSTLTAPFHEGSPTFEYRRSDGYGLVDAVSAIGILRSAKSSAQP